MTPTPRPLETARQAPLVAPGLTIPPEVGSRPIKPSPGILAGPLPIETWRPKAEPPLLPVLIDTREQAPWIFPGEMKMTGKTYRIETRRTALRTADYSLEGLSGRDGEPAGIAVERKSGLDELAHNLTAERPRFERELERLCGYETALLVVEGGSWDDVRAWRYQSRMTPGSFEASLHMIEERYRIPIVFCDGPHAAMVRVANTFRRYVERLRRLSGPPTRASP